jgi:glycosyltransferase involved in cell wall biosynthesis
MANTQAPPLISIITVVYNSGDLIERTLQSVFNQDFGSYEHVIVDGKSNDETLDIISKYKNRVGTLISEPDEGLYDAMNKGIDASKGKYVYFLNAGDVFNTNHVLNEVASLMDEDPDIVYGDTLLMDENGEAKMFRRLRPPKQLSWQKLKHGMLVCHQAFFVKKDIAGYYDLNYQYSADYDWMIRCLKKSRAIQNSHLIIAKFLIGGLTKSKRKRALKERFLIMANHYGILVTVSMHVFFIIRYFYTFFIQIFRRQHHS